MAETESGGAVGPMGSDDALVDSALAAMAEDGFGDEVTSDERPSVRPGKGNKPPPEPAEELDEDTPDEGVEADEEPEEDEDVELDDDADDDADDEPASTRGSEKDPFLAKELPSDKFVKIKVDGEEMTVSFAEMAQGYIRTQTFHRYVNKAKDAYDDAEEIAERAVKWQENHRAQLQRVFSNPDELLQFFLADDAREQVLHAVATRYAQMVAAEKQDPAKRLERHRQRSEERLRARERALAEQERQTQAQRQQERYVAQRQAELAPAWQAGLKDAGFPKVTPELQDTVKALLLTVTQRTGKPYTPEDLRAAVVRAAKIVDAKPASQAKPKPRPAPVAPRARERKEKGPPPKRGSVEALLAGLKPPRI